MSAVRRRWWFVRVLWGEREERYRPRHRNPPPPPEEELTTALQLEPNPEFLRQFEVRDAT